MNSVVKILILALVFLCGQSAKASWIKQDSGTLAWLHSIYFVNQDKGWIVGSKGTFLTTNDGGVTWRQDKKFTNDSIRDIHFSNPQNGWLLCERDIYAAGVNYPSYLLHTEDGGVSWEKIDFTESKERATRFTESKERIAHIFFAPNGNGFAVGESGAFWRMKNNKKTWEKNTLPVRYLILAGKFTDDLHGLIVGGGGTVLFTEDGGLNWDYASLPESAKTKLNSIFFIDQKIGWMVGEQGKIYFSNNGGRVWVEQNSNINENISDIFFVNPLEGFAVADNGTILHTLTAGNTWKQEQTNFKYKLEKVVFVNKKGFAVGLGGTILMYDSAQITQ